MGGGLQKKMNIFWGRQFLLIFLGGPIKIEYFLVFNVGKRVILSVFQQLQIFLGGMLKIPDIFGG